MSKYELAISPNYASDWTVTDAIRELFQNALDQQIVDPTNTMYFNYDIAHEQLTIGNKLSKLEVSSLLLGATTKADDERTIGQFGEGYKIATLVLLRLHKGITFLNYGKKEVWRPRLIDSKRYSAKLLTFFVDRNHIWDRIPDNNLTIVVGGIDQEEYQHIVDSNLHLQPAPSTPSIVTKRGQILMDSQQAGRVYVNGLYVCTYSPYKYGYNFAPGAIKLDRDRKLISDFDLKWLSSSIWSDADPMLVTNLARDNCDDVAFVSSQTYSIEQKKLQTLYEMAFEDFRRVYGIHAIPVRHQSELIKLPAGVKGIIVNDNYYSLVTHSSQYQEPKMIQLISPLTKLNAWFDIARDRYNISGDDCATFERIVEELEAELDG